MPQKQTPNIETSTLLARWECLWEVVTNPTKEESDSMVRRLVALAGLLALVVSVPALAAGPTHHAKTKTHKRHARHHAKRHALDLTAKVHQVKAPEGIVSYDGKVSGKPFGHGSVVITVVTGKDKKQHATFTADYGHHNSVHGTAVVKIKAGKKDIVYSGTGDITGGTGAYRHAHGRHLSVHGTGALTGGRATLHLKGRVTY